MRRWKAEPNDDHQDGDDEKIKFATGLARDRTAKMTSLRVDPSGVSSNAQARITATGNPNNEQQHHQTQPPIRNFEERKNLTCDLHQQQATTSKHRDLVNIAG